MRRSRLVALAAAVSAAVLVGACGGGEEGTGRASSPAEGDGTLRGVAQETAAAEPSVPGARGRVVRIRVGGVPATAEIAEKPEERKRGLMGRDSLPEDHGMLFVYSRPQTLSFWMRNTEIPLSIAFLDPNGTIVDIQHMEPRSEDQHVSRARAMYALEMRLGWFEEHGVEVGDRVEF